MARGRFAFAFPAVTEDSGAVDSDVQNSAKRRFSFCEDDSREPSFQGPYAEGKELAWIFV